MLRIGQSVGHRGRNLPHDVAVVQYMLRRLPRFKDGRKYFSGKIDGIYGGPLSSAVLKFHRDLPEEITMTDKELAEFKKNERTFSRLGIAFKSLAAWVSDDRLVREGSVIKGTHLLYFPGNHGKSGASAVDFLIPDTMPVPGMFRIGGEAFVAKIEAVSIDESDFFRLELSLKGIGNVIDSMTLKPKALRSSRRLRKIIGQLLQNTAWKMADRTHYAVSGGIDLVSQKKSHMIKTHRTIISSGFLPRALEAPGRSFEGVRIPSRQQIERIAADLYTAVCAGPHYLPKAVSIDARVQQLVQSIVKKAPTINSRFIERHCQSCEKLAQENVAALGRIGVLQDRLWAPQMRKDIQKLEESRIILDMAAQDTTAVGALLDTAFSVVKKATRTRIPLIVDSNDLENGEIDFDFDDLLDTIEFSAKSALKSVREGSRAAGHLRMIARVAGMSSGLLILATAVEVAVDIASDERSLQEQFKAFADKVYLVATSQLDDAREFMLQRGNALSTELHNIALQLEAERLILQTNTNSMAAAKCPDTYYAS